MLCFYTVAYEPILRHCSLCTPTENILRSQFLMFSGGIERDMWHKVSLRTLKSSRSQIFFRIGVLKHSAIFKGKRLSRSLFLIKLQASSPAALLKRDSNSGIFLWILRNFLRTAFFIEHIQWLVLNAISHLRLNLFCANN